MDKRQYEITTYRSDGTYKDGRRPDRVYFSKTLEEDVIRRDFTINGLAYNLADNTIFDYVGGLEDLKKRIIRTIGSPVDRFNEDGLRLVRACRFSARLNFEIEEATFEAIKNTRGNIASVSMERIRDEFMKLLESEKPSVGIENLRKTGLLEHILPELDEAYGVEQNKHHVYDVYYHSLYSCDAARPDLPMIRLSALLHDIGKVPTRRRGKDGDFTFYNHEVVGSRMVKRIMKRLKYSNEDIQTVYNLTVNHMFHYKPEWTDGAVRRFIRKVGLENIDDLFLLRQADRMGNGSRGGLPAPIRELVKRIEKVVEEENAITVRDLNIDGYTIMTLLDIKPGPVIGRILNELLEEVLDDPHLNSREILISKVSDIYERRSES
jgi:tRNA nucleotidyltransferase (CCA-adding enzyme)